MIHHRERLTFGFEPRHHLRRVQARFDHFQRDLPMHRARLFGQPNVTHAPLAKTLEESVRTNADAAHTRRELSLCQGGIVIQRRVECSAHW